MNGCTVDVLIIPRQEGRPLLHRSQYLVGDKAYSNGKIRQQLRWSGTTPVIRASKQPEACTLERNRVKRLINRLKQYRQIATRY